MVAPKWSHHRTIQRERAELERVVRKLKTPRTVIVDDSSIPILKRDRYGNITFFSEVHQ